MQVSTVILALFAASAHAYLDIYEATLESAGPSGDPSANYYTITDSNSEDVCNNGEITGFPSSPVNNFCDTPFMCTNGNTVNLANGPCTGKSGDQGNFYANLYSGTDQSNMVGTCEYNTSATGSCESGITGTYVYEIVKCSTTYC